MFDSDTLYLERLGSACGVYRLERVLCHDQVRTSYLAVEPVHSPDSDSSFSPVLGSDSSPNTDTIPSSDTSLSQRQFNIQLFHESFYASGTAHTAIESYVNGLQAKHLAGSQEILKVGLAGHGEPYLVTKKLAGDQLSAILEHRRLIEIDECLRLGILASQALHELHQNGFVHGFLSPRSIWVDEDKVLLSETAIGYIAALASKPGSSSVGIPLYMSAEQLYGQPASVESDTYALALILYECLTGLPPQTSSTVVELALQRKYTPPGLGSITDSKLPPEIEAFFRKALSNRKSSRYPDALELNEALVSVQRRLQTSFSATEKSTLSTSSSSSSVSSPASDSGPMSKLSLKPPVISQLKRRIPHRYKILRHTAPTNLTELQRVNAEETQQEIRSNQRRNRQVNGFFAVCAIFAVAIYAMTLSCLASMQQDINSIEHEFAAPVDTPKLTDKFIVNPPKLEKGELYGETKLDSVIKFASPYGLRADGCIGDFHKIAALNNLEWLSLSITPIADEQLKGLVHLPLKFLDISRCQRLTGEGFRAASRIPTLRSLHAEQLELAPEDLSQINPQMNDLRLKSCQLNDECAKQLARVKSLTRVTLQNNQLTSASLKYFRSLPRLYYLDLQDNRKLTEADIDALIQAMPDTVIRFNAPTPINSSLFQNVKLERLLEKCDGVHLNAQGSSGNFAKITRLKNLEDVDLSRSTIADKDFKGFSSLPLRYVGLAMCKVGSGALKELEKLPHLIVLDGNGSSLRDDDLAYLNTNLRELDLSNCHITDRGVRHLSRLKRLVSLNLNNNGITPDSFDVLRNLKSLRQLDLRDCSNISTEQAKTFEDSLNNVAVKLSAVKR
jgi:serine/threonine protein kinase